MFVLHYMTVERSAFISAFFPEKNVDDGLSRPYR